LGAAPAAAATAAAASVGRPRRRRRCRRLRSSTARKLECGDALARLRRGGGLEPRHRLLLLLLLLRLHLHLLLLLLLLLPPPIFSVLVLVFDYPPPLLSTMLPGLIRGHRIELRRAHVWRVVSGSALGVRSGGMHPRTPPALRRDN
jgi:hypothetical protein